jgi:hypothetical protein
MKNTPIEDFIKMIRIINSSRVLSLLMKGSPIPPKRPIEKQKYQLRALDSVGNYSNVVIVKQFDNTYSAALIVIVMTY